MALCQILILGICGGYHTTVSCRSIWLSLLVQIGLRFSEATLCTNFLDELEDLGGRKSLGGTGVHDLRERLAIVLEPKLLSYKLVLIGNYEVELLDYVVAASTN